ncbi:MAG: hypothetical protein AMS23_00140 [Bacteroides sp. SM1_62]|nr:MAG: hypothetical protein AMS23_00140 [Bacteroides sp. SM1_62]
MNREGDIVLIYYKSRPTMYARIEAIVPDIKKDWYNITLLILAIPQKTVTWTLREEYINGSPFTMDGNVMTLKKVERILPKERNEGPFPVKDHKGNVRSGKIIPFKKNP